jgi:Putative beta barrel porin-7 (BBP7)
MKWYLTALAGWVVGAGFVIAQGPLPPMPVPVTQDQLPTTPGPTVDAGPPRVFPKPPPGPDPVVAGPRLLPNDAASACESGIPAERCWINADYLLWRVKNAPLPVPLLTIGDPNTPAPFGFGALDAPNTSLLFGGNDLNFRGFSGSRLDAGVWLDADRKFGLDLGGFLLQQKSYLFQASSDNTGTPLLAVPFIDVVGGTPGESGIPVSFPASTAMGTPAQLTGSALFEARSQLWSAEASATFNALRDGGFSLDFLVGARYVSLQEDMQFTTTSTDLGASAPFGILTINGTAPAGATNTETTFDRFLAENRFYGGQVGARMTWAGRWLEMELLTKLAMGANQEKVAITGYTVLLSPSNQVLGTGSGGFFALPSNIGEYSRTHFTVIPEVGFNFGVHLTDWLTARFGYTFLYVNDVVRPGPQIDRVLNSSTQPLAPGFVQNATPARPGFAFSTSDFWAQGVNVGLEFKF